MKFRIFIILIIFLLAFQTINAQTINWLDDLSKAKKLAQKDGKPILIDFTAKWCAPCKAMDREFWTQPEIVEISKDFVCVKIDYDKNFDLRRKYTVRGIPYVLLTDSWGTGLEFQRGYGKTTGEQIIGKIKSIPKDFSEILKAGNKLEDDENNSKALMQVADFYQDRNYFYQSSDFYARLLRVEKEAEKREKILLNLGFNYLRLNIFDEAGKFFVNFQNEFPKSEKNDMALYGEIYALSQTKQLDEAEKKLKSLENKFPKSEYVHKAERIINSMKSEK